MCAEDSAWLHKADAFNIVGFWTTKKTAHGGFHHQFDELLGSIRVAAVGADAMKCVYYKVEEKLNREAHHRNVLGPVVVSAMHRSGLLSQYTMKQVQALWDLTCVGGELGWYIFFVDTVNVDKALCVRVHVHCMRAPCPRVSIVRACPAPSCTCPAHTCAQALFARGCHASFVCIDLSPQLLAYGLLGGCTQAPLHMWVHAYL